MMFTIRSAGVLLTLTALSVFALALFARAVSASSTTAHLRAHLTPDALAAWQAQPDPASPPPALLDAAEIDDHDPAAVTVRAVDPAAITSADWATDGTEIATDGTAQAVLVAARYTLRSE